MDESLFLEQLNASPGDLGILRAYATWLTDRGDPRGEHLAVELDLLEAEKRFAQAKQDLGRFRGSRPQDFDWLNHVNPMVTRAPVGGTFYAAASPHEPPFVQLGDFCDRSSVVGIIEAGKVFFHVPAGHSGIVVAVHACNGGTVTAGETLFNFVRPQKADALQARRR